MCSATVECNVVDEQMSMVWGDGWMTRLTYLKKIKRKGAGCMCDIGTPLWPGNNSAI